MINGEKIMLKNLFFSIDSKTMRSKRALLHHVLRCKER
jgi:hypothetical protein